MVHSLLAFHQYLLDKPFELHMDNASLQWLNRQLLVSHHHTQWLDTIGAQVSSTGLPVSGASPDSPSVCFIWCHYLLYCCLESGDCLCIPTVNRLCCSVLEELHAMQLDGHFRPWAPGLVATPHC